MSLVETIRQCFANAIMGMMLLMVVAGCHAFPSKTLVVPYDTQTPDNSKFTQEARTLNARGVDAFNNDNLPKAESLFRDALKADNAFGPAHNNLGQIYLARHQLYLAAWEFEYASNLMPDWVEPIIGQGLAYETGEKLDRAIEFYRLAYDHQPKHPIAISSLIRAMIKQDEDPAEIAFLLDELIMIDGRQEWVQWAKQLRATRYRHQGGYCPPSLNETFPDSSHGMINDSFPLNAPESSSSDGENYLTPWADEKTLVPNTSSELPLPEPSGQLLEESNLLLPSPVEIAPVPLPDYSQLKQAPRHPIRLGRLGVATTQPVPSREPLDSFEQWKKSALNTSRVSQVSYEAKLKSPQPTKLRQ